MYTAVEHLALFNPLFIFQNDIGEFQNKLWQKIIGHIVHVVFNLYYYLWLEYSFFQTQRQTLIISPKTVMGKRALYNKVTMT